jgi:hypothetical protein
VIFLTCDIGLVKPRRKDMEAPKTISGMLSGNKIIVPPYQRAYSWDVKSKENTSGQVNVFLDDLENYVKSSAQSPYYLGHFLFEEISDNEYAVIDGQQRLTTIVILLSALFSRLESIRPLTESERELKEDMVKRNSTYRFSTVCYDDDFFKDYVIEQRKHDRVGLETQSAVRIADAFDFFKMQLADKDENYLLQLMTVVKNTSCTIHSVTDESEAIQMFIFQNNRGKKPSNLEIIKAEFMFNVHLYGGTDTPALLDEIKTKFEKIYTSIVEIEPFVDEDDVLLYTLRVYFNSLDEANAVTKINKCLAANNRIEFIKDFTYSLSSNFNYLNTFFTKDAKENYNIHSLIALGGYGVAVPFILKAYSLGLNTGEICKLCTALETLLLRHRIIGTRADIVTRINGVYKEFGEKKFVEDIVEKINWMKTQEWWWGYWNNAEFERAISGWIYPETAKFLLWKYENYLISNGKPGYKFKPFNSIAKPHLEHIAPQTPTNGEPVAAGYCDYDDEFKNEYIDCLGNYLLLSAPHNESIGNKPFEAKRATYTQLIQQIKVQEMTQESRIWDKNKINKRHECIKEYILKHF